MRIARHAFAKINLDLRIVGVRSDGYHDLSTVFQTIDLHDTLFFDACADDAPLILECRDAAVPAGRANLVWRAAARLWERLGRGGEPRGVHVTLVKRIPAEGGLGGGSADAAVALAALAGLWRASLDGRALTEIASELGADVAFFLRGGTARGVGRGHELEAWPDAPPLEVVLVFPTFGVSTADAYRWYDESGAESGVAPLAAPADTAWRDWLSGCRNDLERPVFLHHPALSEIKDAVRAEGAVLALLAGSGSTVFGLFDAPARADQAAAVLRRLGLEARRARLLSRRGYASRAFGSTGGAALPQG